MPRLQTHGIPLSGDHVACMWVCLSDPDQLDHRHCAAHFLH